MNTTHAKKEAAIGSRMMRVPAAAAYLNLAASTLAKMRMRGNGPAYVKVGKTVLYDQLDCEAYLASRRRHSTSEAA